MGEWKGGGCGESSFQLFVLMTASSSKAVSTLPIWMSTMSQKPSRSSFVTWNCSISEEVCGWVVVLWVGLDGCLGTVNSVGRWCL